MSYPEKAKPRRKAGGETAGRALVVTQSAQATRTYVHRQRRPGAAEYGLNGNGAIRHLMPGTVLVMRICTVSMIISSDPRPFSGRVSVSD